MGYPDLAVVTGTFGYTGGNVARRLIDQGVRVRTLTRCTDQRESLRSVMEVAPLDFADPDWLLHSGVLYSTYWIRYARGHMTFDRAVENTGTPFDAALGVRGGRIVHFSVTKTLRDSELPYFRGKAQVEEMLKDLGVSYVIIRPTLVFGVGDLLLNNMARALRRFPVFPVYGNGEYPVQPVYAEDLAAQAVEDDNARQPPRSSKVSSGVSMSKEKPMSNIETTAHTQGEGNVTRPRRSRDETARLHFNLTLPGAN